MNPEWHALCRGGGFTWGGSEIAVQLPDKRRQTVVVEDQGDGYLLWSTVAKARIVRDFPDIATQAWERNRSMVLVGFQVDRRGNLIGEVRVPKAGLTPDEWQFLVVHLAQECDRFEFQLTGEDREG